MKRPLREFKGPRSQAGFISMMEAVIATSVLALLATAAIPGMVNKALTRTADLAVNEVYTVGTTAQSYRQKNGGWPDAANNCVGAINVLVAGGYLAGFTSTSPYGTTITTNCTGGNLFSVSVTADTNKWAQYMGSQLFSATVAGSAVTSAFPLPGSEPALANLLHRYADPAHPEYNQMETAIDMNNNDINNGNIINTKDLKAQTAEISNTLQWGPNNATLSSDQGGSIEVGGNNATAGTGTPYVDFHYGNGSAQDYNVRLVNDADGQLTSIAALTKMNGDALVTGNLGVQGGIAVSGDVVNTQLNRSLGQAATDIAIVSNNPASPTVIGKPNCASLGLTPHIYLSISGVAVGNPAYPIYQAYTYAQDNGNGTWTPHMMVLTSNNATPVEADPNYGQMQAIVKCD